MRGLNGSRVVLGVSGGIAAYKAVEVCRRLIDAGATVLPVLTEGSTRFVGATTFSALASEPVRMSLFDDDHPIPHTYLGQSADVVVVCPATARVISDYRVGRSADLLTATLIATEAPVVLAPAMHAEMWNHPATQDNIATLLERGVTIVGPDEGPLAGGDIGAGRLADPEAVVEAIHSAVTPQDLVGEHVVVTAGGTREPIDPVRYLGNRSSGKQGIALAREAIGRGARVTLVSTVPVELSAPHRVIGVGTAEQMYAAVMAERESADVLVMAAAVADFRPVHQHGQKLKKREGVPEVTLEPTVDILATVGASKLPGQMIVGFAAETSQVRRNAAEKLVKKGADLIVANDVSAPEVGFGHETNEVLILGPEGAEKSVPLAHKRVVAGAICDEIVALRAQWRSRDI